ncbi:hypothetical protein ANCCAN_12421 [Ancylostoma caninum]|uniref:CHHC U11-48K-type domain-containing protein n=1 Tax=Ancylostoma caninum TaxID=29170 RepID=A0A368GB81_ANCCA|nr:hypothetical protein ANCCAN_12421 [Ancylostoma caninum]
MNLIDSISASVGIFVILLHNIQLFGKRTCFYDVAFVNITVYFRCFTMGERYNGRIANGMQEVQASFAQLSLSNGPIPRHNGQHYQNGRGRDSDPRDSHREPFEHSNRRNGQLTDRRGYESNGFRHERFLDDASAQRIPQRLPERNDVDRPATDLEVASKEARTLFRIAPVHDPQNQRDPRVVMCRFNPTHILDLCNIDAHQRTCKDRRRLEEFGCKFRDVRVSFSVFFFLHIINISS